MYKDEEMAECGDCRDRLHRICIKIHANALLKCLTIALLMCPVLISDQIKTK